MDVFRFQGGAVLDVARDGKHREVDVTLGELKTRDILVQQVIRQGRPLLLTLEQVG